MQNSSFAVKAALLATLISSGQVFAQNLPDEINYPKYEEIHRTLRLDLEAKTAKHAQLSEEKAKIEQLIAQMEKDQVELPARNEELKQLINGKRRQIEALEQELRGLEGVMGKLAEDLAKLDAMVAQLNRDLSEESARLQNITAARKQTAQDAARVNANLQREIQAENQSVQLIARHQQELQRLAGEIAERDQERRNLAVETEKMKRDVITGRAQLNQTNTTLNAKKAQSSQAQAKLPGVKADLAAQTAKMPAIDADLAPKEAKLKQLKADLAARQPEVTKLEKENSDLRTKIADNKAKIDKTGYTAKVAKVRALEKEIEELNSKIASTSKTVVDLKEALKPELGQEIALRDQLKEAQRTRNDREVKRIKAELDALAKRIAPKRQEITKTEKLLETLSLSLAPKTAELKSHSDGLPALEAQVKGLQAAIADAEAKIKANTGAIAQHNAANAGLIKEVADMEKAVKAVEAQKAALQTAINNLKKTESDLTASINSLKGEVSRLEKDAATLTAHIAAMDKAIKDYPQANRRLELNIGKLNEAVAQKRQEALREEQLLQRIRQDRVSAERELASIQGVLQRIDQDLAQSQRLVGAIQKKVQEEQTNRATLARYNQDTTTKFDGLKQQKSATEAEVSKAQEEIGTNEQDLATISGELPKLRADLGAITPKVNAALASVNDATNRTQEANHQYNARYSLYQQHLSAAQTLGSERAGVASVDGDKAGKMDARVQAVKMATENAATHGKWEALLRGYVRGEIAGFEAGYNAGMNSESDASRGIEEGRRAGARRAQDHANMVLKPEFYVEEMDRRIKEDEVLKRSGLVKINSELLMKSLAAKASLEAAPKQEIPSLTAQELNQARQIGTSLDGMIEQAQRDIRDVLNRRTSLADARNAYSVLTAGANASNPNCSGVYKNVKDFVEACKDMYGSRYHILYMAAHFNAFHAEYGKIFLSQVETTFNAELNRLYPGYLNEAQAVGQKVGEAQGQKEIYRQSFERSEKASYANNLPLEEERVQEESVALVNEHLARNGVLSLKGSAKLVTTSDYGIGPGAEVDLSMIMKNVGGVASLGDSLVKITEVSPNLVLSRSEAPVGSVAPKSATNLTVMKLVVSDNAVPGTPVVLAGQIIHPGNHYRANRVEAFRIESVLEVNPFFSSTFDFDISPKVAGLFGGIKEHTIEVSLRPKYHGVQDYEVSLEEVGSNYVTVLTKPVSTGAVKKDANKKLDLRYKMSKSAKGKTLMLKVTVKHNSRVVESFQLNIKPH